MNEFLAKYMGYIINAFCGVFGNNFALAIFMFTLFINVVFCPINIKQQKSAANQSRIKNKLEKLKEKYADDKVKYQEEMGKLYQETGASPFSGCLLLLVRMPFFFGIYYAIQQPLTHLVHANAELISGAKKVAESLGIKLGVNTAELDVLNNIDAIIEKGGEKFAALKGQLDFDLFGLDLTQTPRFSWNFAELDWICLIPLLSFATAFASSLISNAMQKRNNPEAPNMGMMMFLMPVFSLWIAFSVPGAVGFYWACSNIVSTLIQVVMQIIYNPGRVVAKTEAKEALARREKEKEKIKAVEG